MEHVMKKRTEKKDVYETRKKPYATPKLTVHGDIEEITEVLRLAVKQSPIESWIL
jgi:hypothetical protein